MYRNERRCPRLHGIAVRLGRFLKSWLPVLFWIGVWQAASWKLAQPLLLASPLRVLETILKLVWETDFWKSVFFSMSRIATGIFAGVLAGTALAAAAARLPIVKALLAPLLLAIQSIPVASFIILVLIWIPSRHLSVFISFIMVLPIIYSNVFSGIRATDGKLLEMAQVFGFSPWKRLRYIYVTQVMPYFQSAVGLGLSLGFKAGVAAEVIGIPSGSIGEKLYNAKIYLDTPNLFAWTVVIVCISTVFEKIVTVVLQAIIKRLERV